MQIPEFIEKSDVLEIHQRQIERFGGMPGIRDEGLLDSALAQPKATFFGKFLHTTINEQAAAYLYHIAKNHSFVDGNKRTAFATMITFLTINGYDLDLSQDEAYALVIQVTQGEMTKEKLSVFLQEHIQTR